MQSTPSTDKPLAAFGWALTVGAVLVLAPLALNSALSGPPAAKKTTKKVTEWRYSPPSRPEMPDVTRADWPRNAVDRFVLQKLEENNLEPAPEASRRVLIRRLYFDLLGLPPNPEEVDAFVKSTNPKAYEELVDRLLDDARYGERWARYWLDLARYADTHGYEGDPDSPHAWRYRDYVIDAFNTDKPYDRFIKEQLAGDEIYDVMGAGEIPFPKPEHVVALTFLRLAPFTEPRGDETRHELLSEMTSTVGSVFLGLTVGCAKCHDHKYDDIPTKDFYRMKAFFATVQISPPDRGDVFQIGGPQPAEFYRPGEQERADQERTAAQTELKQTEEQYETLGKLLQEKLTKAREKEKPVDLGQVRRAAQRGDPAFTADESTRYLELRALRGHLKMRLSRLRPLALSLRHSFGPPYEPGVPTSRVMLRGQYDKPGEIIEPGFPSAITGHEEPAPIRLDPFKRWPTRGRRMALAQWIASPENPLTARVMVNRIWQHHFGRGIVSTPSDFGVLGALPTHPELLDWLATEFVESKWSIKSIHRLLLNSSTYRQTSLRDAPEAAKTDPDNDLLWRFRRRRLEAEAIRDSVLAVSGRLNPKQFGVPIFPALPEEVDREVKWDVSKWDTSHGAESRRRSIYIYQQRTLNMPFLDCFDAKVADTPLDTRPTSVTALQSLEMYNGALVNEEAIYFAQRVAKEGGDNPRDQIALAFQLAFNRAPTEVEADRLEGLLQASAVEDVADADGTSGIAKDTDTDAPLVGLCRVLLNSNEFVYID